MGGMGGNTAVAGGAERSDAARWVAGRQPSDRRHFDIVRVFHEAHEPEVIRSAIRAPVPGQGRFGWCGSHTAMHPSDDHDPRVVEHPSLADPGRVSVSPVDGPRAEGLGRWAP